MKKTNTLIVLIVIILSILVSIFGNFDRSLYKFLIIYSIIPVIFLPYIIKWIFKIEINEPIIFIYLIFVFFAHFLGTILDFYKYIPLYDKLVHTLSGVMSSFLALFLLHKLKVYDKRNLAFNILFVFCVVLSVASLWEFYEFTFDNIFNKDAQKVLKTGVTDTMTDMIVAFIGSCFISLMYWYETTTHKKLIISKFIKNI